ncbi:MAG TPA: M23 family metallopeptidase, partial [Thermodesulfobacteriota bacterium]|nr:M23 family metallopeptidase [Thermodesulfobacteriota bacterium]
MKTDHKPILGVTVLDDRGVKYINIRSSHVKIAFFTLIGLAMISLSSFGLMYKFYKKAKINARQKREVVTQLKSQLSLLDQYSTQNELIEEKYKERLKDIEEKLVEMEELLSKKGIKKRLSVGGEFLPNEETDLSYVDFIEKDLDELFTLMESFPLGTPLLGKINSGFGYRRDPFNSRSAFHSGVDIDANQGQRVNATAEGIVEVAGWYRLYGRTVIVRHQYGYQTLFGHLSGVDVKKGQKVKVGDLTFVGLTITLASNAKEAFSFTNSGFISISL